MEKLFEVVLQNSIVGIVFVGMIFIFRYLTRKLPKMYVHILWILLIVELLVPAFITNPVYSVREALTDISSASTYTLVENTVLELQNISEASQLQNESVGEETDAGLSKAEKAGDYETDIIGEQGIIVSNGSRAYFINSYETDAALGEEKSIGSILRSHFTVKRVLMLGWIAGMLLFTLIYMEQYIKLRRRLRTAVKTETDVWETEQTEIPFVMPGFPAKIILPAGLAADSRKDILAHERMHIRHFDPLVRFMATAALIVHWFNPFVWLAYRFMSKDMEMFCDESVLKNKGLEEKKHYSQTLLDFAMKNNGFSLTTSFGEKNTRSRIEHILYGRKPKQIISILLFAVVLIFGAFFLTSGKGTDNEPDTGVLAEEKDQDTEQSLDSEAASNPTNENLEENTKKNETEIALKVQEAAETEEQQSTQEYLKKKITDISLEIAKLEETPEDSRPQERWEELHTELEAAKAELMRNMSNSQEAELAILEAAKQYPADKMKIAEDFLKAEEAYSWFTSYGEIGTNQIDYELLPVEEKGFMYAAVEQEGITSLATLEAYLSNYFEQETVEELMAREVEYCPLFKEENGMLYGIAGYIGNWCEVETRDITIEQKDAQNEAVVTLSYHVGSNEIAKLKYPMILSETGNWKFAEKFIYPLEEVATVIASHSGFWDYTGYLDECILWSGYEQFANQDYDKDGLLDRVYRTYDSEAYLCQYRIELGNGIIIPLTPEFSNQGEPVIQTADLDGNGENEIVFTMSYYTSTNPMAFGELEVFQKVKNDYQPMELPLVALSEDSYEKGLRFAYEVTGTNFIKVTCKGAAFSHEMYIADDLFEEYQQIFTDTISECCVYQTEIIEEDNVLKLKCQIAFFDKWDGTAVAVILKYDNGMQIERMELVS